MDARLNDRGIRVPLPHFAADSAPYGMIVSCWSVANCVSSRLVAIGPVSQGHALLTANRSNIPLHKAEAQECLASVPAPSSSAGVARFGAHKRYGDSGAPLSRCAAMCRQFCCLESIPSQNGIFGHTHSGARNHRAQRGHADRWLRKQP